MTLLLISVADVLLYGIPELIISVLLLYFVIRFAVYDAKNEIRQGLYHLKYAQSHVENISKAVEN